MAGDATTGAGAGGTLAHGGSPEHYSAIVESSDDAILSKDRRGIITSWNPAAERLYGYSADEAIGQPIGILIPGRRSGEELEILERVMRGGKVEHYETERVRKDGEEVVVSLTVSPVRGPEGAITAASVIARDITERRGAEERAEALQRLMTALSREVEPGQAIEIALEQATRALGADAGAFGLVDESGEEIRLADSTGYTAAGITAWQSFPLSAEVPMAEVVRTGEPVWCGSGAELVERYPALSDAGLRYASLAVVPLRSEAGVFGALALSFDTRRRFEPEERAFMLAAAQQAANAIERTRLYAAERAARERMAFLAGASEILASSLDLESTLERLAQLAVPRVADWCAIDLAEDGGLRSVAVAHSDPRKVAMARELRDRYPIDPASPTGAPNVIRTGQPETYPEIPEEMIVEAAEDEEHLRLLRELDMRSAMIVPLNARGRSLGAITLVSSESGRTYGPDDLGFAQDLARRAALAVDNALLYRQEHEAALTLQRALLPRELPEVEGLKVATRYLPAEAGMEVGGDWFDVIERDSGITVVVGDVAGRGVRAASIMGQLRIALRSYLLDGHRPAPAVERLSQVVLESTPDEMATLVNLTIDLGGGEVEYVRAGHPPPLLRTADCKVRELAGAGRL